MLIFLGALPLPLHGMSSINKKMLALFRKGNVTCFNLVPSYAASLYPTIFFTIVKVLHLCLIFIPFLFTLWINRYKANIYFSIAGGSGKLFDLPFMFMGGLLAKKIYVHHHSFAYCNQYDALLAKLITAGKDKISHIALCDNMKQRLTHLYNISPDSIDVLSNAAFFDNPINQEDRTSVQSLGFISNISFDKGIREFIETFSYLKKNHPQLKAYIAGPCLGTEVFRFVEESCTTIADLHYLGKVYGKEKDSFFNQIDVLLFPTSYVNEAEPLTIYEAFSCSIPVIAWSRGCISGMINHGGGDAIDCEDVFSASAIKTLSLWLSDSSEYQTQVQHANQRFSLHRKNMQKQLYSLIQKIGM